MCCEEMERNIKSSTIKQKNLGTSTLNKLISGGLDGFYSET